jgi:hypothetical protein
MAKKEKPKRINKKTGKVDPGAGKVRPHHKEVKKRVNLNHKDQTSADSDLHGTGKIGVDTYKHRLKQEENKYIPQTANKYQHNLKKVNESKNDVTYEWFEDNGHADHLQYKRKTVAKEGSEPIVLSTITSKQYQENYQEIFGEKKRGVDCEGGYKKFKKTYK